MVFRLILVVALAQVASAAFKGSTTQADLEFSYYADGTDNTNWKKARDLCSTKHNAVGSSMAMIKTFAISNSIANLLYPYAYPVTWVGGWDEYAEGYWTWIDGTPFDDTYTNWNPGEPSNSGIEDWLEINYQYDKGWNDKTWGALNGYMCQMPVSRTVESDYSELTIYDQEKSARTFSGAKMECEKIGARLVQIPDETSKIAILRKMKNVGIEKYWVDKENSRSRCSILSLDSSEERDCSERFRFICETARPNLMKVTSEEPIVTESGGLEIECTAKGFPIPDVAWYVDNEPRTLVPNQIVDVASSKLVIKNASPDDAKRYLCIATNTIDGYQNIHLIASDVSVIPE